ncbi:MAG: disulfide bond formation protein B [Proteobacteria bacterium]|nr:disulfide bond formation protein B [Pseudomonadota bacterium]
MINRIDSEQWALCLVIFCGAALSIALIMEHAFALAPCPLCLMQRIWVFWVGAFAYVGLIHNPRWGIYPLLSIVAAIVGAGFSIRQLYLQGLPAGKAPACGAPVDYMIETSQFAELLAAMTRGTGDCATVSASLLGISIPGWVLMSFVAMMVIGFLQWRSGGITG